METNLGIQVFSMALYIAVLLVIVDVMRKNPRFALVFWVLALLTFPLWGNYVIGWFRWVKTLSVLLPTALLVGFGRYAELYKKENILKIFRGDWLIWTLYGVLFLNIAEATLKDFQTDNIFNAVSGAILCITQPLVKYNFIKKRFWSIGKEGSNGDLIAYTNGAWNFLYTTWNLAFVYGEAGTFFASSCCILLAAELYPILLKRPELYITARVYTLATHILLRATGAGVLFEKYMNASNWIGNSQLLYYWGLGNMILHIPYLFYYFWTLRKTRKLETERVIA